MGKKIIKKHNQNERVVENKLSPLKKWFKNLKISTIITTVGVIIGSLFFPIKGCIDDKLAKKNYVDLYIGDIKIEGKPFIILYLYPYRNTEYDIKLGLIPIGLSNTTESSIDDIKLFLNTKRLNHHEMSNTRFLSNNSELVDLPPSLIRNYHIGIANQETVEYTNISSPMDGKFWIPEVFNIYEMNHPYYSSITLGSPKLNIPMIDIISLYGQITYEKRNPLIIDTFIYVLDVKDMNTLIETLKKNKASFPRMTIQEKTKNRGLITHEVKDFVIIEMPTPKYEQEIMEYSVNSLKYYHLNCSQDGKKAIIRLYNPKLNITNKYSYEIDPSIKGNFMDIDKFLH